MNDPKHQQVANIAMTNARFDEIERRLAALERVSGGAPGARGEETAAPTSNPEPPVYDGPRSPAYLQTAPTYIGMDGRKHFRGSEDQYPPAPTLGGVAILSSPSAPEHLMASAVGDPYDWKEAAPTSPSSTYPHGMVVDAIHVDGSLTLMDGTYWKKDHDGRWERAPAPTSHAWTEEQREAARSVCAILIDASARSLHSDYWCEAIAKVAPIFAPPKPAPSVEDCERAYFVGSDQSDSAEDHRAGIAAVRALCIENTAERTSREAAGIEKGISERGRQSTQADQGLPRPLDGGNRANERGEGEGRGVGGVGRQAPRDAEPRRAMGVDRSDGLADGHHGARPIDRAADDVLIENKGDGGSVAQLGEQAEQAQCRKGRQPDMAQVGERVGSNPTAVPSPTFTPDREALARAMSTRWANDVSGEHDRGRSDAQAAMTYFAPLIAERDALRTERDEARAEHEKAMCSARLFCGAHIGVPQKSCPVCDRDALRARIAELERNLRFAEEARSGYEATAEAVQTLGEFLSERGAVMAGHQHSYVVNAARKRIAELEARGAVDVEECAEEVRAFCEEARKPTVTRDALAEAVTCHAQTSLTDSVVLVMKRAGIEVTP